MSHLRSCGIAHIRLPAASPFQALGRRRIGHCQWLSYRALKESVSFGTGVPPRDAGARHCLPLNRLYGFWSDCRIAKELSNSLESPLSHHSLIKRPCAAADERDNVAIRPWAIGVASSTEGKSMETARKSD